MEIKTEAGYDMPGGEEICLKTEHFQVFADSAHRKEAGQRLWRGSFGRQVALLSLQRSTGIFASDGKESRGL